MKEEDKKERAKLMQIFLDSKLFVRYIKPMIEDEIKKASDIRKIDERNIEKSYYKQKIKLNVYQGILAKFYEWSKYN